MLKQCPECELPVSDKAYSCPHCGYPIAGERSKKSRKATSSRKRRKLPNGFGQISEIKNQNLRKPFRAMVTVGTSDTGRPICKLLKPESYFKTYNEAYEALVKYNRNPYDLADTITMSELFEKWSKTYYTHLNGRSRKDSYNRAWNRCSKISDMRVVDVRPKNMKECIYSVESAYARKTIKMLLNLMFDYAVEYEMTDKNYARIFKLDKDTLTAATTVKNEHVAFSDIEISKLWANINVPYVDAILVQTYMGWRPKELCEIALENINLESGYIVGGMKTAYGFDRVVPIHSAILDIVKARVEYAEKHNQKYLFDCPDSQSKRLTYGKYLDRFHRAIESLELGSEHRPHDPRKTFVTLCKKYNVDEYAIKRMVGHSIADITERVYTERSVEWLSKELEKIKCPPESLRKSKI